MPKSEEVLFGDSSAWDYTYEASNRHRCQPCQPSPFYTYTRAHTYVANRNGWQGWQREGERKGTGHSKRISSRAGGRVEQISRRTLPETPVRARDKSRRF